MSMGAFYKYDGTVGLKPGMEISNFGISIPISLASNHARNIGLQIATGILALFGLIFYKWSETEDSCKNSKPESLKKPEASNAEKLMQTNEKHQIDEIKLQNYLALCEEASKRESMLVPEFAKSIVLKLSRSPSITNSLIILAAYTYDPSFSPGSSESMLSAVWEPISSFLSSLTSRSHPRPTTSSTGVSESICSSKIGSLHAQFSAEANEGELLRLLERLHSIGGRQNSNSLASRSVGASAGNELGLRACTACVWGTGSAPGRDGSLSIPPRLPHPLLRLSVLQVSPTDLGAHPHSGILVVCIARQRLLVVRGIPGKQLIVSA
jgi:hypothetical protein